LIDIAAKQKKFREEFKAIQQTLSEKEKQLLAQQQTSSAYLDKISEKDQELDVLNDLLQKSIQEVTIEGIVNASQLDAKTAKLSKRVLNLTGASNSSFDAGSSVLVKSVPLGNGPRATSTLPSTPTKSHHSSNNGHNGTKSPVVTYSPRRSNRQD